MAAVTAILATLAGVRSSSAQQSFSVLVNFNDTNGGLPHGGLAQGFDGNLYGTTLFGGTGTAGTVFRMTPAGALTTLHSFCSQTSCIDGEEPEAQLIAATDGNLCGTTVQGGANGAGTIFKISSTGNLNILYSFCSQANCTDGVQPNAGVIEASDNNFYGTTYGGGSKNYGTIYRITPKGVLTTLYSFCTETRCADGIHPYASLIQGSDGNFYGTTSQGGATNYGTIFRITPSDRFTTLHSFCGQTNCPDGARPWSALLQASDGNFYGTSYAGGANLAGTVFRMTPTGALTTIYSFCAQTNCTDGTTPVASMIEATDGNLYGTTLMGGSSACQFGCGTIFQLTPSGVLATLHSFDNTDGYQPYDALFQATNGAFYGVANGGGTGGSNSGTAFRLDMGLGPFVQILPSAGKIGAPVRVLGTNLTGATSVTFNGTAAVFKTVSPSLITATVPAGATTGAVQVVTPGGTLKSNMPFRVVQ